MNIQNVNNNVKLQCNIEMSLNKNEFEMKVTWWKYVFIVTGDALKCWTCSSDLDPHCADPFNNTSPSFDLHHTLTDCNTQSSPHYSLYKTKSVCKKIKQTGKYICTYWQI